MFVTAIETVKLFKDVPGVGDEGLQSRTGEGVGLGVLVGLAVNVLLE